MIKPVCCSGYPPGLQLHSNIGHYNQENINVSALAETAADGYQFLGSYGCRAFLPHLRQADWGHIINTSSVFGRRG